ncbi:MAG: inner membrane CreD family protein, partial [Pseudomonadota bacterium]
MTNFSMDIRNSVTTKAVIIGVLTLVLLIPVAMVNDTIQDRARTALEAEGNIMQSWGGHQLVSGPILVIPYEVNRVRRSGELVLESGQVHLLPATLAIDARLQTEVRHR